MCKNFEMSNKSRAHAWKMMCQAKNAAAAALCSTVSPTRINVALNADESVDELFEAGCQAGSPFCAWRSSVLKMLKEESWTSVARIPS